MRTEPGERIGTYQANEVVHEGPVHVVYRATDGVGSRVVLKTLRDGFTPAQRRRLELELARLRRCAGPLVVAGREFLVSRGTPVLVLEDFGARSLLAVLDDGVRPGVTEALRLAIEATRALAHVHAAGVLHRDVSPGNLLVDAPRVRLKIADLDMASAFAEEPGAAGGASHDLTGTLAYLAPEQTGRVNRPIDERSDLYGLGATLYHLFSGRPPFLGTEPTSLVHAHLAVTPVSLEELVVGIPPVLAAIVARLLSKAPEGRYRSAAGLLADLLRVQSDEVAGGHAVFELGRRDVGSRIELVRRLYGREHELDVLRESIERACSGRTPPVFVAGYPGVGKSALVDEARRTSATAGVFVSGKFEPFQRGVPFAALSAALERHVRVVLGESDEHLGAWRVRARARGLVSHAHLLAALVPSAEHLLGRTEEERRSTVSFGADTQQHLYKAVRELLLTFATADAPVVLFLDDMQWADAATTGLVERLAGDPTVQHLALILAYRDNEVDANHPLARMRQRLAEGGHAANTIELGPLGEEEVGAWLADTLARSHTATRPLARLVVDKTGGNPFFVGKFLEHLHERGWVQLDVAAAEWRWDLAAIQRADVTRNVVDLLVGHMATLPPEARRVLSAAAVAGAHFELRELAELIEVDVTALEGALAPSVDAGFLRMDQPGTMRFHHDQIQEAATRFLDTDEIARLNWAMAERLLARPQDQGRPRGVLELATRMNHRTPEQLTSVQRAIAARINGEAAAAARRTGAFAAALGYARAGLARLPPPPSAGDDVLRDLHLALLLEAHAGASLSGEFGEAERLYEAVIEREQDYTRVGPAHVRAIQQYVFQSRYAEALALGLRLLDELGFPVRLEHLMADLLAETDRFTRALASTSFAELLERPPADDERAAAAVGLMGDLAPAAFFVNPLIAMLFGPRTANVLVEKGTVPRMAYMVSQLMGVYTMILDDPRAGFDAVLFAMELARKMDDRESFGRASMLCAVIGSHWVRPLAESVFHAHEAFDALDEHRARNLQFLAYTFYGSVTGRYESGEPLPEVEKEIERALQLCDTTNDAHGRATFLVNRQVVRALTLRTESPTSLGDGELDEAAFILALSDNKVALATLQIHKLELANLHGDEQAAALLVEQARPLVPAVHGFYVQVVFHFHAALALARELARRAPLDRPPVLEALQASEKLLEKWSVLAPSTYAHKLALVQAEKARALGRDDAIGRYEAAVSGARLEGFRHEEGLAAERAWAFCLERGYRVSAGGFLERALSAYTAWGATARVEALRARLAVVRTNGGTAAPGSASTSLNLDVDAVMRAVGEIGWELDEATLIENLMRSAVQNAGAERGLLLLTEHDVLRVVAEADAGGVRRVAGPSVEAGFDGARTVVDYVRRTREPLELHDPASGGDFQRDPYVRRASPRSVLGMPILRQGQLVGVLYLENRMTPGLFDARRVQVVRLLAAQAAIALDSARLHGDLEHRVDARTEQLRAANQRALEAARAKDTFLATMSHEIRTPMNAVIGMTGLLLDTSLDAQQRELVETVRSSGDHLLTIINDILDFSKIEAGKLELERQEFDLRICVEDALDLLAAKANEKQIELAYVYDRGLPRTLVGDAARLRQVLVNLVGNAVKFTDYGEVVVQVSPGDDTRTVRVRVRDTGIGIAADRLGELFHPFSQVHSPHARQYGGTGLGLAISQRLAEAMGGRVSVESELGVGTTCLFTFVTDPSPGRLTTTDPALAARALIGLRVLVVDDNPTSRGILRDATEAYGMQVRVTGDPREALAWVRSGEVFDLALVDHLMHDMDGLTLAREIRKVVGESPLALVILTAAGRQLEEVTAAGVPRQAIVTKPLRQSSLHEALLIALGRVPVRGRELRAAPAPIERPMRILLAEDNPVNQRVALLMLEKLGQKADAVGNGAEAIAAIAARAYDVVLMDVQMPELDGLDASRIIRAELPRHRQPRIIAMTANALAGDRERCLEAGMDDYVTKPVKPRELADALRRCLAAMP